MLITLIRAKRDKTENPLVSTYRELPKFSFVNFERDVEQILVYTYAVSERVG